MASRTPYIRRELEGIETLKNYLSGLRPADNDNEIPDQIMDWLMKIGWHVSGDNEITLFSHHENFPGLYMQWYEAVSCEFMRFLTIGNVGRKDAQD